tara:strand:- start:115 stop:408 length:294 start_codon:yes stop_codon:yes gene_type:complete
MKNGLTKFVLLIDYHGEYSIKLDNLETQKHIYENIDDYQMVSQIECEIPQESHNNNVSYLEETIINLENKLSVQDDLIAELQEERSDVNLHAVKGGE